MMDFQTYLQSRGGVFSHQGRVTHFSRVDQEYRALLSAKGAGVVPLLSLTPLRVSGSDRLDFLHGQLSNEVKGLSAGATNLSLMLNHKGHALAQMRVYRREQDVFLAIEGDAGERVKEQLQAHIIFDQVELNDLTGTVLGLSVQGRGAPALIARVLGVAVPEAGSFVEVPFESAKVLLSAVTRGAPAGLDVFVLERDALALIGALLEAGALLVGEEALELARVSAGIAAAYSEGGDGMLPQECGLEGAVSYRKGCYLGQEIMARIESRGAVRKRLMGVRLARPPAANERTLLRGGKRVGRIGRWVEHPELGVIALASVRHELAAGETALLGEIDAQLCALPFV